MRAAISACDIRLPGMAGSCNELEAARIKRAIASFLDKRRPPVHIRTQLDIGYRQAGNSIELFEIRPQWDDPRKIQEHPFAKATWVKAHSVWKIFWRGADLKWHGYAPALTVPSIDEFFAIVDADRHGCFFG